MRGGFALALIASATVAACTTAPPSPANEEASRGRDYAISHCAGCHNIDLKGTSTYPAAPPFRKLRGGWNGVSLQVRLERSPLHRGADMPPRYLSQQESEAIAAFIAALRAGKPPPGPPLRATICNPMWWC